MRKNNIKWSILLPILFLFGCSDFLKESSQDEIRPATVNDLEQLLLGEGYLRDSYIANYLDLLTDDIENNYSDDISQAGLLPTGAPIFSWQKDMYEKMAQNNTYGRDTWERLYGKIKGCNVILDALETVSGSEGEKLNLRGQALAMRAFYYFTLVNLYGQPYNAENVDITKSPGVPLILESAVKDDFPPRASVAEVYEQVEKDLLEALPLIEQYGQKNYKMRVTDLFVHTLLSRMYLYMENWEKTVTHADYVIKRKPALINLADQYAVDEWWGNVTLDKENGSVYNIGSIELIWGYSNKEEYATYFQATQQGVYPVYAVSASLKNLYVSGDLRTDFYYQGYVIGLDFNTWQVISGLHFGSKTPSGSLAHPAKGMRVAEAYLNKAEAKIRLAQKTNDRQLEAEALEDLNFLRSHRFTAPYTKITLEDVASYIIEKEENIPDLLQFCREERRRELSFEDHRWFDLRRYGMPELVHSLSLSEGQATNYRLPAKGDRYVLPIAQSVLERNPSLVQNP
ncbi:MAG: RagB/SusD family nutrient uptake outer membrane protein [Odoribacter sp.]|nr:RagB/SusD family nutrient uptake outer membrane protein [Odoribacter sp.]